MESPNGLFRPRNGTAWTLVDVAMELLARDWSSLTVRMNVAGTSYNPDPIGTVLGESSGIYMIMTPLPLRGSQNFRATIAFDAPPGDYSFTVEVKGADLYEWRP